MDNQPEMIGDIANETTVHRWASCVHAHIAFFVIILNGINTSEDTTVTAGIASVHWVQRSCQVLVACVLLVLPAVMLA